MNFFYIIIGIFAGLHAACYGAYKDSPYEKFLQLRFIREILIGLFVGVAFILLSTLNNIPKAVFFLIVLAWCRIITEWYKQFIRMESQEQYKIPSIVHVFGKVIISPTIRLLIGVGLVAFLYYLYRLMLPILQNHPVHIAGAFIGLMTGLVIAAGGGYKDGFFEGFDRIKFFRSPIIALLAGFFLSYITSDLFILPFAAAGLERMITECYKGFFKAKYVPGKFKYTKATFPQYFEIRHKYILPMYIFTWGFFFFLLFLK